MIARLCRKSKVRIIWLNDRELLLAAELFLLSGTILSPLLAGLIGSPRQSLVHYTSARVVVDDCSHMPQVEVRDEWLNDELLLWRRAVLYSQALF
jgi:pimeloyl-ACP methyl ester carboxylesterase